MNKKLLFICAILFVQVKSDCQGFECFSNFFVNFFADEVEHVNATATNLPENFVQVKDVVVSDLNKVLSDISSFITQDVNEKSHANFDHVNPETRIFVQTFHYNNFDGFDEDLNITKTTDNTNEEQHIPQNIKNNDIIIKKINKDTKEVKIDDTPKTFRKTETNPKRISDNEIPLTDDIFYYDSSEDNSTDYPIIDYVDLYKDTTNEENVGTESSIADEVKASLEEYTVGLKDIIWEINNNSESKENTVDISDVYPWITSIFIRNDTKNNQFEYFCDGALLNDKLIITAARCVNLNNSTVDPNNLLVILGKRSLQAMDEKERPVKIKRIIIHENFTNEDGATKHDLALLMLDESVQFNEIIQPATIGNDTQDVEKLVTTAWDLKGDMVPVYLDDKENKACNTRNAGVHMFCATFGLDVALCPSYGGVFAAKQEDSWLLYGIRSSDPTNRGLCIDKHLWFTDLRNYGDWILDYLD